MQSTIVRIGVIIRKKRRKRQVLPPDEELREKLRDLGLLQDRIWWGPMTLHPVKAKFIINQIEKQPPSCLLEVGGGSSTALFAALAEKYDFNVITLENHQGTIDYIKYLLDDLSCCNNLTIQKCGFVRRKYISGEGYRWYSADLEVINKPIDFVFIDGPMGTLVGRNGALPEIIPYLSENHRIFLDDSQRAHEQYCIKEWKQHYPELIVKKYSECPGVGYLILPFLKK